MATVKLIHCNSDGTVNTSKYPNGIIDDYTSFTLSLNRNGGFSGASLSIRESKNVPYRFSTGDLIKPYLLSDNSLICTLTVSKQQKNLARKEQSFVLKSKWELLGQVNLDSESFGTQGNQSTVNTIAGILQYIHTNFIGPVNIGINWNAAKVSGAASCELVKLKSTSDIYDFIQFLETFAGSDGSVYSCVVDENNDLYFKPIPNTVIATVDVNENCLSAVETLIYPKNMNTVAIKGSSIPTNGYTYFRKFNQVTANPRTKIRIIHAPEIHRQSDAQKVFNGVVAKYSNPSVGIQDLEFTLRENEAPYILKPWLGKVRYIDTERSIDITDYINQVDIDFGNRIVFKVQLGLQTVSNEDKVFGASNPEYLARVTDKYNPEVLDLLYSPAQKEQLLSLPEATEDGLVYPTVDGMEPHLAGPEVPIDSEALTTQLDTIETDLDTLQGDVDQLQQDVTTLQQGGGAGGSLSKYSVLSLNLSHGLKKAQEKLSFFAEISNGKDSSALNTPNQVNLNYKFVNEGGAVVSYGSIDAQRVSQDSESGIEIWKTGNNSVSFSQSGIVYCALSIGLPNTNPQQYKWYPADITGTGQEYLNGIPVRVFSDNTAPNVQGGNVYMIHFSPADD